MAGGIVSLATRKTKMDDAILYHCNETELLEIARLAGLGRLRRGLPIETLAKLVAGEMEITDEHRSAEMETRGRLQKFIWDNIARTRSQLPGCDGRCTTYPCSGGRHAMCFGTNQDTVR
jgi:hypothetical protein